MKVCGLSGDNSHISDFYTEILELTRLRQTTLPWSRLIERKRTVMQGLKAQNEFYHEAVPVKRTGFVLTSHPRDGCSGLEAKAQSRKIQAGLR